MPTTRTLEVRFTDSQMHSTPTLLQLLLPLFTTHHVSRIAYHLLLLLLLLRLPVLLLLLVLLLPPL